MAGVAPYHCAVMGFWGVTLGKLLKLSAAHAPVSPKNMPTVTCDTYISGYFWSQ